MTDRNKIILTLASFFSITTFSCTVVNAECSVGNTQCGEWVLTEKCGVLDAWRQSEEIVGKAKYRVDYFRCSNTATDSGDMCPSHPCKDCNGTYCAEGSEMYEWVSFEENIGPPPDKCDTPL